ncbi:MAG: hypothetical protein WCP06_09600 [Verrucomicrobiota bacterium]
MKNLLLALCPALLLCSCATSRVVHTEVATAAVNPRAIYIRPFPVEYGEFRGCRCDGSPIRRALASIEFANDLKEELSKLAPARVLKEDEYPRLGWMVDGYFELVDAVGHVRHKVCGHSANDLKDRSRVALHVRITDVDGKTAPSGRPGVVYEFDVAGGSRVDALSGSAYSPGLGDPMPFDFRNAAERIMVTLSTDPFRYGVRDSPMMRN